MHKCWYSSTEVTSSGKTLDPYGNVDPSKSGVYTGGKSTANYRDSGLSWHLMEEKSFCGVYWQYVGYMSTSLAAANLGVKAGDYIRITNAPDVRAWAADADADAAPGRVRGQIWHA